ncbi:AraC family transcriptional regulator [Klebsiella aerogenes]|uniref:AraC family transcriptional regulator n=2 Tax=Klebsiella aerogenes TaxID=548 RepID=UPI0031018F97
MGTVHQNITMDTLSSICGKDCWSLSRCFRTLFGTSPYRYVTMRRLAYCRHLIQLGLSLAGSALEAVFSDESHVTCHFIKADGISPGR